MSDNTKIEWAEATWSPVTGCTRVSEGCRHCYIERTPPFRMGHRRFDSPDIGATTGVKLHSERLHIPLKWRKSKRIFVCSLADLFQDEVPDRFIVEVFAVMALAPRHTFQVLTKRHARLRSLLGSSAFPKLVENAVYRRNTYAPHLVWPLPNVWAGVSVEDQKWADIRIPVLLETPAAVRWISAEPLLGPIDLHAKDSRTLRPQWLPVTAYGVNAPDHKAGDGSFVGDLYADMYGPNLDWVVVGGESGPGARPMHPAWAQSLRDQCVAAGVPFLFKQHGAWAPSPNGNEVSVVDTEGHEWPARMFRGPKAATGRTLDGRTWDEYPEAS